VLRAGYQVYQAPGSDRISLWPRDDTPGVHWLDPGTPTARPDLVRERRRLQQQGLLQLPPARRPGRVSTQPGSRGRRRGGPGRRTRTRP
jgi:hypothetical protein